MKKRKPYTRLLKWTNYHRNASVRLDEQGADDKPFRAVIYFERLEDDRWLAHQEMIHSIPERTPSNVVRLQSSS